MKKTALFILLMAISHSFFLGQVIIDDTETTTNPTPHPSAILELKSNTKGFLPPRMNKAQRENIDNPAVGLIIYLIEDNVQCLQAYDGVGWADIYCPTSNTPPTAKNITITGSPVIGNTLNGSYTYFDVENDAEQNSIYNWYTITSLTDTNYVSVSTNTNSYTTQSSDEGKYIVFSVTPKAQTGSQQGQESYSTPLGPVDDNITANAKANINEFHYDNAGTDTNEFVEVKVLGDINNQPVGIGNYKIIHYNGSNGSKISSEILSNMTKTCDATDCYYVWNKSLQNGPDALALINDNGGIIEFLSYEGTFTASEGEASGDSSTDIGASQGNNTTVGSSIYLDSDNTWKNGDGINTKGTANF